MSRRLTKLLDIAEHTACSRVGRHIAHEPAPCEEFEPKTKFRVFRAPLPSDASLGTAKREWHQKHIPRLMWHLQACTLFCCTCKHAHSQRARTVHEPTNCSIMATRHPLTLRHAVCTGKSRYKNFCVKKKIRKMRESEKGCACVCVCVCVRLEEQVWSENGCVREGRGAEGV